MYLALPLTFDSLADTLTSLLLAFLLGGLIGAERQYRERTSSLRTHVLVAIGSAAFVDMAVQVGGPADGLRVMANIVTGVGFLGAGLILKEGANIRGLNTAATVWCSAAVGACAGANLPAQAVLLAVLVLLCNTALRPVVNAINRIPVRDQAVEAHYELTITVPPGGAAAARDALTAALAAADYPVSKVEQHIRGPGATEVVAGLLSTSVEAAELDRVVVALRRLPGATDVAWSRKSP
jgi:putative Mg2+ transporter-C (MgtC) family protein